MPDSEQTLAGQLGIEPGEAVGLVGAGGKTTTLLRLLHELRAADRRIITTSTVHMFELRGADPHPFVVEPDEARLLDMLPPLLLENGHVRVAGERLRADKIRGLDAATVDRLKTIANLDNLLIECDGARHRSLKAPAEHEPVIPATLDLLLIVVGLDVIGKPLNDETVHRAEQVQALTGLQEGAILNPEHVATVLTHPNGGLKDKPPHARAWIIATKLTPEREALGADLAAHIFSRASGQIEGVILLSFDQMRVLR